MVTCEVEKECLKSILCLTEAAIKNHYDLHQAALETQRLAIDRMWVLAQRYTILIREAPSKRNYPPEACHQVEDDIRSEFHMQLSMLDGSNLKLTSSLTNVKESFYAIGQLLDGMDSSHLTSMDQLHPIQPPISYYMEIYSDFVKYFTHNQTKLDGYAILLRIENVSSLENYKALLEANEEFNDHFLKSLAYYGCSCKKEKT